MPAICRRPEALSEGCVHHLGESAIHPFDHVAVEEYDVENPNRSFAAYVDTSHGVVGGPGDRERRRAIVEGRMKPIVPAIAGLMRVTLAAASVALLMLLITAPAAVPSHLDQPPNPNEPIDDPIPDHVKQFPFKVQIQESPRTLYLRAT